MIPLLRPPGSSPAGRRIAEAGLAFQRSLPRPKVVFTGPVPLMPWQVILADVAAEHGVTVGILIGRKRPSQAVSLARQHAMHRLSTELGMTDSAIARRMGDRHHTTIRHGIDAHAQRLEAQT